MNGINQIINLFSKVESTFLKETSIKNLFINQLKKIKPAVISLAFDPEGSGPDKHYKTLQAIAEALREWGKEKDFSKQRILGYCYVWYRFKPKEAIMIIPQSLNAMVFSLCKKTPFFSLRLLQNWSFTLVNSQFISFASLKNEAFFIRDRVLAPLSSLTRFLQALFMESIFSNCYLSQVDASFPSYELNGKFSTVSKKIWVEQLSKVQFLLRKNYFYQNKTIKSGCAMD